MCTCVVPTHMQIPDAQTLEGMSVPAIRQLANAHNLGASGKSEGGHAKWRIQASKTELLNALYAHRDGTIIMPKPAAIETVDTPIPKVTDAPNLDEGVKNIAEAVAQRVCSKVVKDALNSYQPPLALSEIRDIITEEIDKVRGSFLTIQVQQADQTTIDVGRQHALFPKLVRILQLRRHTMLVGPAGSGKTEGAMAAAKALGLSFEIISVGPQTTQSELAGYRDANGNYRDTALRRAYEQGRLLIIDELDAGNGGVFTFVNACLSNKVAGFPDGPVQRHENFCVVGCANTFGTGADMQYVGRAQLDAATLDRFGVLVWDYDEGFEMDLALAHNSEARPWVETIWKYRRNMLSKKIRHVISPRASINGAVLMKAGFKQSELEKMLVFKGLPKEIIDKIKGEQHA